MRALRSFALAHRNLAACLIALALMMKVAVPAGFMFGTQTKFLTIEICADASGGHLTQQLAIPVKGDAPSGHDTPDKATTACPYAALSMASLARAAPPVLAAALVFIVAAAFLPVLVPLAAPIRHLRPDPRGPPTLA